MEFRVLSPRPMIRRWRREKVRKKLTSPFRIFNPLASEVENVIEYWPRIVAIPSWKEMKTIPMMMSPTFFFSSFFCWNQHHWIKKGVDGSWKHRGKLINCIRSVNTQWARYRIINLSFTFGNAWKPPRKWMPLCGTRPGQRHERAREKKSVKLYDVDVTEDKRSILNLASAVAAQLNSIIITFAPFGT